MTSKSLPTCFVALFAALVFAAPALALTPTNDVYSGFRAHRITVTQDNPTSTITRQSASSSPSSVTSSSTLPFTGFEVGVLVLAGLVVIGTGLLLRRASRSD